MRTIEELMPVMKVMGRVLTQYATIARKSFDFGVGMPLYPAEIHFISSIDSLGNASITELAREAGVTKGAASQLATKLEKKGLLNKEQDPANASRLIISLTSLGQQASDNHRAFHQSHDADFIRYLATMDDSSFAQTRELVECMDKWMQRYLK